MNAERVKLIAELLGEHAEREGGWSGGQVLCYCGNFGDHEQHLAELIDAKLGETEPEQYGEAIVGKWVVREVGGQVYVGRTNAAMPDGFEFKGGPSGPNRYGTLARAREDVRDLNREAKK